jgi:UDP-N-acetylglucosamine acyltransferase
MASIHPSAVIDPSCELAPDVSVGPFCVIVGKVRLGAGVQLVSHVTVHGPTTIGAGTVLYPGACIGLPPQDLKFKIGDPTPGVVVGEHCLIRENVTVHAASKPEAPTTLGNRVFMMGNSHVGHDGWVGNNVILVNNVMLAGHVKIFDNATVSGGSAVHQFCRIGRMAFVSGMCAMAMEVPPFCVGAYRNAITGVNLVGMRRAGIAREHITAVRDAYWHVLRKRMPRSEIVKELQARAADCPLVGEMAEFVATAKRPVARGLSDARIDEIM